MCIRELFPCILLYSKTRIHQRVTYIAFPVQAKFGKMYQVVLSKGMTFVGVNPVKKGTRDSISKVNRGTRVKLGYLSHTGKVI